MPIRLNLLAETQAEEEMRRRDPVKRSLWLAGCLVGCVLVYSAALLVQTLVEHSALNQIEARLEAQKTRDEQIINNQKKLTDTVRKLDALHLLAANRFLWGNVMNALQLSSLEDVQLTRFHSEQTYAATDEVKPVTGNVGHVIIGKPGFVTQKINFLFDAKDISSNPGDRISKYKNTLAAAPFFGKNMTNNPPFTLSLKNLSVPSFDPQSGKTVMFFSLECRLPEMIIK